MNTKPEAGPCILGEHFVMSAMLAMIAERHATDSPMRMKLETWTKENIPSLMKKGNETGDLAGAFKKYIGYLQVLLSQNEADRDLSERAVGIEANRRVVNDALAAGNVKEALEAKVFFLLKAERYRDLQHPDIRKLIELAALAGDRGVFIRLGRALSEEPRIKSHDDIQLDKLQCLLVLCWLTGPHGEIGLSRLTDEALTDFCNLALGVHDLTFDGVRKTRQRLGLVKGPRPWFKKVEKTKEGIVVSLDE